MGGHRLNVLGTWVVRAPGCLDGYGRKHGRVVPEGDGKDVTDKRFVIIPRAMIVETAPGH